MKLGLGSVQFGIDYGATNTGGKVAESEVVKILKTAADHGIDLIDTAAAYGDAESVLHRCLPADARFAVVSKTLPLPADLSPEQALNAVAERFRQSLQNLACPSLYGLLVHRADDLLGPQGDALFAWMDGLRVSGQVQSIGVSVYSPEEADTLLARYPIGLIQLPLNVLDQRFIESGSLARLKAAGVEIHVRSIFLQGLLLADPEQLARKFSALGPILTAYRQHLQALDCSPLAAAFAFAGSVREIDAVIVGAAGLREWQEILSAWQDGQQLQNLDFGRWAVNDEKLIDPRKW